MRLKARAITQTTARFDLGKPVRVDPLEGGYLNDNYRLVTDRGVWMLKHHRDVRLARLRVEHRMLRQLADHGVPVAGALTSVDGAQFGTSERRPLVVYDWVSGDHLDGSQMSLEQCGALGHALASIHEQLGRIKPCVQQSFWAPTTPPQHTAERIATLLEVVARRRDRDPFDDFTVDHLLHLREHLQGAGERRQPAHFAHLALGYVHGDFNPNNVMFQNGEIVAILDWERTSVRPRVWELIRSVAMWFASRTRGTIDLARAAEFVRAYAASHKIDPQEIEEMIHRFWWDKLNDLWIFDKHYHHEDDSADQLAEESAQWVRWWGDNLNELTFVLTRAVQS